jgi:hypothetical protein
MLAVSSVRPLGLPSPARELGSHSSTSRRQLTSLRGKSTRMLSDDEPSSPCHTPSRQHRQLPITPPGAAHADAGCRAPSDAVLRLTYRRMSMGSISVGKPLQLSLPKLSRVPLETQATWPAADRDGGRRLAGGSAHRPQVLQQHVLMVTRIHDGEPWRGLVCLCLCVGWGGWVGG